MKNNSAFSHRASVRLIRFLLVIALWAPAFARAATYHVDAAKDDDAANAQTPETAWRTIGKAARMLQAGDTVIIHDGVYNEVLTPANSGKESAPITYKAADGAHPIIRTLKDATLQINDKDYLTLDGLWIYYSGHGGKPLRANNVNHLTFRNCVFDLDRAIKDPESPEGNGFVHHGSYLVVERCVLREDSPQDFLEINGDHAQILYNDLSHCKSGHGPIHVVGDHVVVRGNYVRAPWGRVGTLSKFTEPRPDVLWEDNIIVASNWDNMEHTPDVLYADGDAGAVDMLKSHGIRVIFRNNIVAGSNYGITNDKYNAILMFTITRGLKYYQHMRVYHNTFAMNPQQAIRFKNGFSPPIEDLVDNRFCNNVFIEHGNFLVDLSEPVSRIPWNTYRFFNNLMGDSLKTVHYLTIHTPDKNYSVAQAQEAYPEVFYGNIAGPFSAIGTFVNAAQVTAVRDDPFNNYLKYADLALKPDSPGRAAACPIATVAAAAADTKKLTVDDAYPFFDGYRMMKGDVIILVRTDGQRVERTVTSRPDGVTLVLNEPVTAAVGDKVYMKKFGVVADLGVIDPTPGEPRFAMPILKQTAGPVKRGSIQENRKGRGGR